MKPHPTILVPSESEKIWLFSALSFLLGVGFSVGFFSSNALLISHAGTFILFYVYLWGAVGSLGLGILFYFLIDRFPRSRVFSISFFLFGSAILLAWFYLAYRPPTSGAFIVIQSVFYAISVLTDLGFWLMASECFSNFQARRRFPLIVMTGIAGDMAGGLWVSLMAFELHAVNFILIWGVLLMTAPLFVTKMRFPRKEDEEPEPLATSSGGHAGVGSLIFSSSLIPLLFLFWFLYSFISFGTDYVFNTVALRHLRDEDALASFFGTVNFLVNLGVLFYQGFFATFVLFRLGIYKTLIALTGLMALLWIAVWVHPSLYTVALCQGIVYFFVDYAATGRLSTLLNLIPQSFRGRVQVFVEGLGRPTGTILLFFAAIFLGPDMNINEMFPILAAASILLLLFFALFFRRAYSAHLLGCLASREGPLLSNAVQALGEQGNDRAVPPLLELLARTPSMSLKRTIVLTLGRIQNPQALQPIANLFLTPNEYMKMAVARALSQYNNFEAIFTLLKTIRFNPGTVIDSRMNLKTATLLVLIARKMTPFLLEALLHEDLRVQAGAIEAIGLLKDPHAVDILVPFLKHPHHLLRLQAAIALYPFRKTRSKAHGVLDQMFHSHSILERRDGIVGVGILKLKKYRRPLVKILESPNKPTLEAAAFALARMKAPEFCPTFVGLLSDSNQHLAQRAVNRLKDFPRHSLLVLLEFIEKLPRGRKDLIFKRLEETLMDFETEKEMQSFLSFP